MIRYRTMADDTHADAVVAMMRELYLEDPAVSGPDPSRFPETLRVLRSRPELGRIILFLDGDVLRGYAILIPYWSNEYGGVIVFVDELFVTPAARRHGIARGLFDFIERDRPFDPVAVMLEVSPGNHGARRLYDGVGLQARQYLTLARRLPPAGGRDTLTGQQSAAGVDSSQS